jgi:hypothetical protein
MGINHTNNSKTKIKIYKNLSVGSKIFYFPFMTAACIISFGSTYLEMKLTVNNDS